MEDLNEFVKIAKIHEEEKFNAIRKHCREYWYEFYKEYPAEIKLAGVSEYIKKRYQQNLEKIYMVTVNPVEGTDINIFLKKIEKCTNKKWVKHFMYCVEWRDMDKGLHCHIRLETRVPKKPSHIQRECYNTFKHLVGNVKHVNVRFGRREDAYVDYIKGIKDGKPKSNSEHDKKLRQHYGISDYIMSC